MDTKPDIILVTEVSPKNMPDPIQEAELTIPGYDGYFQLHIGRGVAIYIASALSATRVEFQPPFCNFIGCQIRLRNNDTLLVGCIYRSPNSSQENSAALNDLLRNIALSSSYTHLLLAGDFNYPEIDWATMTCQKEMSHPASVFLETLRDCDLKQHIEEPTHYRPDCKPNVLDLVLTNEQELVEDIRFLPPIGKSHHLLLEFNLKCYLGHNSSCKQKKLYHKADYNQMRSEIAGIDWIKSLQGMDIQCMWDSFLTQLTPVLKKHIPTKKTRTGQNTRPPWMTAEVQTKLRAKRDSFKTYKENRTEETYKLYARARGQAKNSVRSAVKSFEHRLATESKNNPKAFFNYARSKTRVRQGVSDLKNPQGAVITEDQDKASALNSFFCSVFTKEKLDTMPNMTQRAYATELSSASFSIEDIEASLRKLNPTKSTGMDGLHPRVLQELSKELATPLFLIFRTSLEQGKVPDQWKEGQVTAIFKKGDRSSPSNYRPVSITSVVSKVMEGLVRKDIIDHMSRNQITTPLQHGFTKGRSTSTNLLTALNDWTETKDKGGTVHAIYLDFQKAFDSVPHKRLLLKLERYGITGQMLAWTRSFLTGRRQCVSVNGSVSDWMPVTSGIPQGSVLGPTLFNIFVNDIPECVSSNLLLFADDGKLHRHISSLADCSALQADLNNLQEWASTWQLRFHPDKCKVLRIGKMHQNFDYTMLDAGRQVILKSSEAEKDLGVWVDNRLRFDMHAEKAVNKASSLVGMIRRTYVHLDPPSMTTLFKSLCRPIVEYGNVIWYPQYQKDAVLVENVQRRATRLIPGFRDKEYVDRLRALKLPSLTYRRERGDMIEVFKHMHGYYNHDFSYLKRTRSQLRGHGLTLTKDFAKHQCRRQFFAFRVVNMWNSLPEETVTAGSLNIFKNSLDTHWNSFKYCLTPLLMRSQVSKASHRDHPL